MFNGAVDIGLERPDFTNHKYRWHEGLAIILTGVVGLSQIEQALQLERRNIGLAQFAALQKPVSNIECR